MTVIFGFVVALAVIVAIVAGLHWAIDREIKRWPQ